MKIKIIKENKTSDKVHAKATYLQDEEGYERDQAYAIAYQYEEDGKLEEMSSMGAGAIAGHVGDKKDKKNKKIEEKFSTVAHYGGVKITIISPEKEHGGHVERSKHQGLRNVMQEDEDTTIPMGDTTKPLSDATPLPKPQDPVAEMLEKNGYKLRTDWNDKRLQVMEEITNTL